MQSFTDSVPGGVIAGASFVVGLIAGSAYGPLLERSGSQAAIPMPDAFAAAKAVTDWRVWAWLKRTFGFGRRTSGSDPRANLAIGVVALFVLVHAYATHTTVVATVVVFAALCAALVTTVTFAALWFREVVHGAATGVRLAMSLVLVGIGIYDGSAVVEPQFHPEAVADLLRHGVLGSDGFSFGVVLYQAIGAVLAFAVLIVAMFYCLASVTAVYIAARAYGRPLWRVLFWTARWTVSGFVWWTAFALGVLSLGLTSGWFATLLAEVDHHS